MIVDLHAHYWMQHLGRTRRLTAAGLAVQSVKRRRPLMPARGLLLRLLNLALNKHSLWSGHGVTVDYMREGNVGVALSVLLEPLDELGNGKPPYPESFGRLLEQIADVETHVLEDPSVRDKAVVAHGPAELEEALKSRKLALVHCVEGGYHLGPEPSQVPGQVAQLAECGVAYITLAHLLWRCVVTSTPAIPYLPDLVFKRLFRQPHDQGLTELGRRAVDAMARRGVLVDVAHMSERGIEDTFRRLDDTDRELGRTAPGDRTPVIASHMACRFGRHEYNLSRRTIEEIARRGGVLGIIFCDHWARSGLRRRPTRSLRQSLRMIYQHVDRIREVTGSDEHAAIGSDLDGFIQPTLYGLDHMRQMRELEAALRRRYGEKEAELITCGNALRVLRTAWRRAMPGSGPG